MKGVIIYDRIKMLQRQGIQPLGIRNVLLREGYCPQKANELTLEMLRVKGTELRWE